jgi:hypothetical protein
MGGVHNITSLKDAAESLEAARVDAVSEDGTGQAVEAYVAAIARTLDRVLDLTGDSELAGAVERYRATRSLADLNAALQAAIWPAQRCEPDGNRVRSALQKAQGDQILFVRVCGAFALAPQGDPTMVAPDDPYVFLAQQRQPGPGQNPTVQPTSLDTIPQAARLLISVVSVAIDPPLAVRAKSSSLNIDEAFTPAGKGNTTSIPAGAQVLFGPSVPTAHRQPLSDSVVGKLTQQVLDPNRTVAVRLGAVTSIYRFTRFTLQTQDTILVELLQGVGLAPAAPATPAAQAGQAKITAHQLTLEKSPTSQWQPAQETAFLEALSRIPDSAILDGLAFRRANKASTKPDEAGECDLFVRPPTITLNDNAFDVSETRYGLALWVTLVVAHEVGHAADLRPLMEAWQKFDAANQAQAARPALLATRSLSGQKWVDTKPGFKIDMDTANMTASTFRVAAKQDGLRLGAGGTVPPLRGGITDYANSDWGELFAEAFAQFIIDPTTLRSLRPSLHAFFVTQFP